MDLKLKSKTALVTGGSEGIGKAIAMALAKEGVDVAICARRKETLDATAKEIAAATNRRVIAIPADLTKDDDAKNFVTRVQSRSRPHRYPREQRWIVAGRRNRNLDRSRLGSVAPA